MYITTKEQLPNLNANVFGVDMEYSNKRICLIQIQQENETYLIDPLQMDIKDYLTQFFTNQAIKVFFSGQQDLIWLKEEYNIEVNNYCDLRVLAQKESENSLIYLWQKYCGVEFNKEQKKKFQKSDWFSRPLSNEQLNYAALDCKYLIKLREILITQFTEQELHSLSYFYEVKRPKLELSIEQQLAKLNLDVGLAKGIYKHIKLNEQFETDDENIQKLITQLKTKQHNNWKQVKQERFLKFQEKFTCHKPIYSNCKIYSKENLQLCCCDQKKMNWYLKNGLAEQINEKEIRLNFEPKFNYDEKEMSFYQEERGNQCVVCGQAQNYLKYSIVPHLYKSFLPLEYKSHRAHDVVVLCARCHEKASALQDKLKLQISQDYNVPLNAYEVDKAMIDKLKFVIKKLQNMIKIKRELDISKDYDILRESFQLSQQPNLEEMCSKRDEMEKKLKNKHGELVISQLDNEEKIEEFIKRFRRYFIETMDPKCLPITWNVDHKLKRNFGEHSIFNKQKQQQEQEKYDKKHLQQQ